MDFEFNWFVLIRYRYWLVEGLSVTLRMAVVSMSIALVLGLIVALMRLSRFKVLSILGDIYVQTFRGLPLFVFLIWVYYGVALLSGINIPSVTTALLCVSMLHSAYLAETYRAGITSVGEGQREAALSVGLSNYQVMRHIVLPQAIRTVLPPIGNEFMVVLKSTTLLGIIGVEELVKRSQLATEITFRPFEFYTAVAVIFIISVTIFSRINAYVERRLSYP